MQLCHVGPFYFPPHLLTKGENKTTLLEFTERILHYRRGRPAFHRESVISALRKKFKDLVFESELKERVAVSTAASQNISVYDSSDSEAIAEFGAMSEELLVRIGVTT